MKKEIQNSGQNVSRRNFLGATAAIGLISAAALSGCTPSNQGSSTQTQLDGETLSPEKEYDVVIVGSGLAGLSAALKLQDLGVRSTILIEKGSSLGGSTNSTISGGAFNKPMEDTEESKQKLVDIYNGKSKGEGNQEITQLIVQNIQRDLDWMTSHGVEMTEPFQMKPFECLQLYAAPGNAEGMGPLLTTLANEYTSAGGESATNTKLLDLVFSANGSVAGIKVRTKNGFEIIQAQAIIIATGGYVANKQYLEQFVGADADKILVRGQSSLTGDGIEAAVRARGMLIEMGGSQSIHMAAVNPENPAVCNPFNAISYTLAINTEGKRYADESKGYVTNGKLLYEQQKPVGALIFDETIKQVKNVQSDIDKFEKQGVKIIEANSVADLAEKINVPTETLQATLNDYNAATDGERTTGLAVEKASLAMKVEGPKYYAFYPLVPGSIMGFGGIYTDKDCQVLEADGTPIGNLYAIGEAIGGVFKYDYLVGSALNRSLVTGVASAEEIAGKIL